MPDNVVAAAWWSGTLGCVGAVAVRRVDGWKAYIGPVMGDNEQADIRSLQHHGAPMAEREALGIFPNMTEPYAQ